MKRENWQKETLPLKIKIENNGILHYMNPVRCIAFILHDHEPWHVSAKQQAETILRQDGCEVFSASRVSDIDDLIRQANSTNKDYIFIHTLAHGLDEVLCLEDGCFDEEVLAKLDHIPYAKRDVIVTQCYGGSWAKYFLDDPRTFFGAASMADEVAYSGFSERLWSSAVMNFDADPQISPVDRFMSALQNGGYIATPVWGFSLNYEGQPSIPGQDPADPMLRVRRFEREFKSGDSFRAIIWYHAFLTGITGSPPSPGNITLEEARAVYKIISPLSFLSNVQETEVCGINRIIQELIRLLREKIEFEEEVLRVAEEIR